MVNFSHEVQTGKWSYHPPSQLITVKTSRGSLEWSGQSSSLVPLLEKLEFWVLGEEVVNRVEFNKLELQDEHKLSQMAEL